MKLGNHINMNHCLAAILLALYMMILCPAPANADLGLPTIAIFIGPLAWLLLLIIIPVEAEVAVRLLKTGWRKALVMVGVANLISTIVGIPVAWFLASTPLLLFKFKPGSDLFSRILLQAFPMTTDYLSTAADYFWITLVALAALCVLFFLMSVVAEYFCARYFVSRELRPIIWQWAWLANGLSYGCIVLLLLVALAPEAQRYFAQRANSTEIYGDNSTPGHLNEDVYIFYDEQVRKVISVLSTIEKHQPQADEVFKHLPINECVAKATKVAAPYPKYMFRVMVPDHGNFIIAAKTDEYINWDQRANLYWLYPVKTDGQSFLKVVLSEKNTVSANVPGQIFLPVPANTQEMELILALKSQHYEEGNRAKEALQEQNFLDAKRHAQQALALAKVIDEHGGDWTVVPSYERYSDAKMLAFARTERGDLKEFDVLRELLYKDKIYDVCINSYYYERLARMYLKANNREGAMATYQHLLEAIQEKSRPNEDTPVALEHYATLLIEDKNFDQASKAQTLASKFRKQLNQMPMKDRRLEEQPFYYPR